MVYSSDVLHKVMASCGWFYLYPIWTLRFPQRLALSWWFTKDEHWESTAQAENQAVVVTVKDTAWPRPEAISVNCIRKNTCQCSEIRTQVVRWQKTKKKGQQNWKTFCMVAVEKHHDSAKEKWVLGIYSTAAFLCANAFKDSQMQRPNAEAPLQTKVVNLRICTHQTKK